MDGKEYLKAQLESMWYLQDSVCKDLIDGQLMELPPGTTSPIGVIWLHLINGQDNFVSIITGSPPLWKVDAWGERFGLENAPNIGEDWTQYQDAELTIDLLNAYNDAVRGHTQSVWETIDAQSLDETVKFFTERDPKAGVWALMVGHTLLHCGEIAALKGVSGGKGLPF